MPHTSALLKLAKLTTLLLDFLRLVDCVPMAASSTGEHNPWAIAKKKTNKMSMQGEQPAAAEVDPKKKVVDPNFDAEKK